MTALFDGMSGLLNETFGAEVVYTAKDADVSQTVWATLRDGPLEVTGGDGQPILILAPTLHVPRNILPNIAMGDRVSAVADTAPTYRVVNKIPNGSPASDAMIICELEEVLT